MFKAFIDAVIDTMVSQRKKQSRHVRTPFHSPLEERRSLEEFRNSLKREKVLLDQRTIELKKRELSIDNLLHELRKINSNLKDSIDQIDFEEVSPTVQNIWAQANLMSIRLRCYDYEINPDIISSSSKFNFPVYRKIDKLRKALRDNVKDKGLSIRLRQNTYLAFRGHDILEVALYIIFENAIKYAVPNSDIIVLFSEDEDVLTVDISNKCEETPDVDEISKLTEYRYRGRNASERGDGIGLYTLQTILDLEGVEMEIRIDSSNNLFIVRLIFRNCTDRPNFGM